ncbi:ABC transporter permease [Aquimarina sp. U1-2]|uniref:ABC transporter permease n=1 Tax=Aquimarina sp. U1-2 TaxID=2823141 RepID=UPI001AECFBD2|nr:ABC transporter permease [Aquimarina sp. U1-2]MBP2831028.1 ABC transporter permease [Aquimarina sp. U1-2]
MKRLIFLIEKEFMQIFRNRTILPMMTILPIIQLLLLSSAASNQVKEVRISIDDRDKSLFSYELIAKIDATKRLIVKPLPLKSNDAMLAMQNDETDIILKIPKGFQKDFYRSDRPELQMLVNAINGQQATVGASYVTTVIQNFNRNKLKQTSALTSPIPIFTIKDRSWYNPELKYTHFMATGILAELTALLTIILSAMNVVRERELGTIEQINVTPIKKWQFILGKLIPFLCIGMGLLTLGLIAAKIAFNIPMVGSVSLLFLYAFFNIVAVLGLGFLISNFAETQQQAIFVAFFFVMIFILMCGLFTPIDSMPKWAQYATIPNPLAHFISVSRKVLLKGSGLYDIKWEFIYTIILAFIFNFLAVRTYKKTI